MAQKTEQTFDPMFPISNRIKRIFKNLEQQNEEVNVLIPPINAGSDAESDSEDEDSFEPLRNIDIQNFQSVDFEKILYENSNNFAKDSTDNFEIETNNFGCQENLFEIESDRQNEQETEGEETEIEETEIEKADQEEDDSNKENSEQPLNLSSKRNREKSPATVSKAKSTKKKQKTAKLEFHWSDEELAFPVDPHAESFITVENILPPFCYFKKFFDDSLLELIVISLF